ncbi:VOC family protein [Micromonospora sp. FIMYZ51]|uniref:VOC family protein n=1 Tax=Micromonospora sp. FIMYZ51 TaxID=3051832 RepID=UPI00311E6C4E
MTDTGAAGQEIFPILTTADLTTALVFYRDLLGGTQDYQFPETGEPTFVTVRFAAGQVGLGRQEEPGALTNDRITLWLYVADCDAALDRLRSAGTVPVLAEPADQPWGERMAIVADPDGNRVIVASR